MAQRILIASVNPWAFCMAAEREFARIHAGDRVDAIDLFALCSRSSPHWRRRDKLIETVNRKIGRFVMPVIGGRNITGDIAAQGDRFPPIPQDYAALRQYELDGAKVGLAVLSSATSLTTIQFPSRLEEFGPVLAGAWRSAHISQRIGHAVRALGYDKVIIFNGRHCYSRPFCDILEQNCEVIRYEQGSAGNRYISAPRSVHHPQSLKRLIEEQPLDPGRRRGLLPRTDGEGRDDRSRVLHRAPTHGRAAGGDEERPRCRLFHIVVGQNVCSLRPTPLRRLCRPV